MKDSQRQLCSGKPAICPGRFTHAQNSAAHKIRQSFMFYQVYETKKKYNKITRVIKRNGKSRIKKILIPPPKKFFRLFAVNSYLGF